MRELVEHFGRLLKHKSLWLFLYLFKAIMSLFLIIPFFLTTNGTLSSSLFSRGLISDWDMSIIVELFSGKADIIPVYLIGILVGAILYIIIMQFLNGGLYYLMVSGEKAPVNWGIFFSECGINFPMHIKISLLMVLIYMILLPAGMFFVNVLGMMGGNLVGSSAFIMMLVKLGVLGLILLGASFFSDSLRAASAAFPDKSFGDITRIAAKYFRPRLLMLLGVFIVLFIPFVLIWVAVEFLAIQVVGLLAGIIGIALEFLLFQFCSFARTGQKIWYLLYFGRDFYNQNPGRFQPAQVELPLGE